MADEKEEESSSKINMEVPWLESEANDNDNQFEEIQEAIATGKVRRGQYKASDYSGSDSSDDDDQDDVEPAETEPPGKRLLWAAQKNRLDMLSSVLDLDPNLVRFADEDGYTALHR